MNDSFFRLDSGLTINVRMMAEGMLELLRLPSDLIALSGGMLPARIIIMLKSAVRAKVKEMLAGSEHADDWEHEADECFRLIVSEMYRAAKEQGILKT